MRNKIGYWTTLHGLATIALVGTALYFLLVEHGPHVLPYVPFLVILLCPLMHLFMHKDHSAHDHGQKKEESAEEAYRRGLEEGRSRSGGH
jgi:hypothetical protein